MCSSDLSPALGLVVYNLQESQHSCPNLQKDVSKEEGLCNPRPRMRYKGICIERLSLSAVCQGFVEIRFHSMLQNVIQNIVIEEMVHYRLQGYDQYYDS